MTESHDSQQTGYSYVSIVNFVTNPYLMSFLSWFAFRAIIKKKNEPSYIESALHGLATMSASYVYNYCCATDINQKSNTINEITINYGVLAASYLPPIIPHRAINYPFSLMIGVSGAKLVEYMFNNYNIEDAASYLVGTTASVAVFNQLQESPTSIRVALSTIPILIASAYGQQFLSHTLPITEIRKSYYTSSRFVNKESLDAKLVALYTSTINLQILLSYLAVKQSTLLKTIELQINNFTIKIGMQIITASIMFRAFQGLEESIISYYTKDFEGWIQTQFKSQYGINNFSDISNSNFTLSNYAKDLQNIASINNKVLYLTSLIPKIHSIPLDMIWSKKFILLMIALLLLDRLRSNISNSLNIKTVETEKELHALYDKHGRSEQHDALSDKNHRMSDKDLKFLQSRYKKTADEIQQKNTLLEILKSIKKAIGDAYWGDISTTLPIFFFIHSTTSEKLLIYKNYFQLIVDFLLHRLKDKTHYSKVSLSCDRLIELDDQITRNSSNQLAIYEHQEIQISNLKISRVKEKETQITLAIKNLVLKPGFYAMVGGPGKTSVLSVLSQNTDESYHLGGDYILKLPSNKHSLMIHQDPYCPLYVKPIEWIQNINQETAPKRIIHLLHNLGFYQKNTPFTTYSKFLYTEHDDLYNSLSQNQVSAIALLEPLLSKKCEKLLIIDELITNLDRHSQEFFLKEIKYTCPASIVIFSGNFIDPTQNCVPSHNLFNGIIHIDEGIVSLVGTCE